MTPWTSVVSYHTDPDTCGVARFSAQLASHLRVPHLPLVSEAWDRSSALLSIKWRELDWVGLEVLETHGGQCDQLWHDAPTRCFRFRRVWKLYEIGVPALVRRVPLLMDTPVIFTLGMAHKIELSAFVHLRALYPGFALWVSSATHEGAGPSRVPQLLQAWGSKAQSLGSLSDAALELIWPRVTAFAAFFEGGVRANNSSVHAALDAGVPVITNWGEQTPQDLRRATNNIWHLRSHDGLVSVPRSPYTWTRLLEELGCDAFD